MFELMHMVTESRPQNPRGPLAEHGEPADTDMRNFADWLSDTCKQDHPPQPSPPAAPAEAVQTEDAVEPELVLPAPPESSEWIPTEHTLTRSDWIFAFEIEAAKTRVDADPAMVLLPPDAAPEEQMAPAPEQPLARSYAPETGMIPPLPQPELPPAAALPTTEAPQEPTPALEQTEPPPQVGIVIEQIPEGTLAVAAQLVEPISTHSDVAPEPPQPSQPVTQSQGSEIPAAAEAPPENAPAAAVAPPVPEIPVPVAVAQVGKQMAQNIREGNQPAADEGTEERTVQVAALAPPPAPPPAAPAPVKTPDAAAIEKQTELRVDMGSTPVTAPPETAWEAPVKEALAAPVRSEATAETVAQVAPVSTEPAVAAPAPTAAVAPATPPPAAARVLDPAALIEQLDRLALRAVRAETNTMQVELEPAALGRVLLHCRETSAGLAVDISVQSQSIRSLLSGQEQDLRSALESQGLQLGRFSVSCRDGDGTSEERSSARRQTTREESFANGIPAARQTVTEASSTRANVYSGGRNQWVA
jgi:hypothetical protein